MGNSKSETTNLEKIFQEMNRHAVKIKKNDRKHNNSVLYAVLDELLNVMRNCDKLFDSMKPKLEYLGSYFDGLRVGRPNEYDLNVMLKLPMDYNKIVLDATQTNYDYTYIIMPSEFRRLSKTPDKADRGFLKTKIWCDPKHRLSVVKFRSWMQSVVDTALTTLPQQNGKRVLKVHNKYYQISAKTSGPANTISIFSENDIIDVDLVPTFGFELPKIPIKSKVDFSRIEATNIRKYFVVPKPTNDEFEWRLTFPFQERAYMKYKNNFKSAVKLIKLLRDVQGFKKLASYYIKSLFLWEIVEHKEDFWKKQSLSYLVLYMTKKLRDSLAISRINNFWCCDNNLLEKIKVETCQNWSNRLSVIIEDIERNANNPQIVKKYFLKT